MSKKLKIILLWVTLPYTLLAQNIGINSTGANPNASSLLDISSTNKGLLVPRVNITNLSTAAPVTSPATSLLVYNTNTTTGLGFYFWNGTTWINLTDNSGNADEDWHEVGGALDPDDINDDIFTMGKVSIGIANTVNNFEVYSSDDPTSIRITEASGVDVNWELRAYNTALGGGNNQFSIWGGLSSSTQTDRLVIEDNGFIGIGTTNPSELLTISGGTGRATLKIEADSDNTTESDQAYIFMEQDGGTVQAHLGFGSTEATGDVFRIGLKGGILPLDFNTFVINAQTKRVGIGTSVPDKPLSVFGVGVPANMTGGGVWGTYSDRRLKKNISDYTEGLSLITKIRLRNYSYNRKYEEIFGGGKSLNDYVYQGVIAQELMEYAPEMVTESEVEYMEDDKLVKNSFLEVNPNKFIYALINSTQQQQKVIENQEQKIKELEARLKSIEELLKK